MNREAGGTQLSAVRHPPREPSKVRDGERIAETAEVDAPGEGVSAGNLAAVGESRDCPPRAPRGNRGSEGGAKAFRGSGDTRPSCGGPSPSGPPGQAPRVSAAGRQKGPGWRRAARTVKKMTQHRAQNGAVGARQGTRTPCCKRPAPTKAGRRDWATGAAGMEDAERAVRRRPSAPWAAAGWTGPRGRLS